MTSTPHAWGLTEIMPAAAVVDIGGGRWYVSSCYTWIRRRAIGGCGSLPSAAGVVATAAGGAAEAEAPMHRDILWGDFACRERRWAKENMIYASQSHSF